MLREETLGEKKRLKRKIHIGAILLFMVVSIIVWPVTNLQKISASVQKEKEVSVYTTQSKTKSAQSSSLTYKVQGKQLPLRPHYNNSRSYGAGRCWAFAQKIYNYVWKGKKFTSTRGTSDDMLRKVKTGAARAINAENTKRFITVAEPGATIRVSTTINGNDSYGRYIHSMILLSKDANGLTIYDSITTKVRVQYFTWKEFATKFGKYRYFKYIKWPNAVAYSNSLYQKQLAQTKAKVGVNTTVKQTKILKITSPDSGKMTVSYQKVDGCTGYQLYYSKSSKFTKDTTAIINSSKTELTIDHLEAGTCFYVKVRAYTTDKSGKSIYGKYSTVKKFSGVKAINK